MSLVILLPSPRFLSPVPIPPAHSSATSPSPRRQELRRRIRITPIRQMRRRDSQRAHTDQIPHITKDPSLLPRISGHLTTILQILRIPKRDDAINRVLHARRQILDRPMHDGGALRVPPGKDGTVGTLRGGLREEVAHLADAQGVGAAGEEVSGEQGGVVDPLNGDTGGAEDLFEAGGGLWTDDGALLVEGGGLVGGQRQAGSVNV
jgi:hypothetical protein